MANFPYVGGRVREALNMGQSAAVRGNVILAVGAQGAPVSAILMPVFKCYHRGTTVASRTIAALALAAARFDELGYELVPAFVLYPVVGADQEPITITLAEERIDRIVFIRVHTEVKNRLNAVVVGSAGFPDGKDGRS